jgi:hypothetical protein
MNWLAIVAAVIGIALLQVSRTAKNHTVIFYSGVGALFSIVLGLLLLLFLIMNHLSYGG